MQGLFITPHAYLLLYTKEKLVAAQTSSWLHAFFIRKV